MSWRQTRAAPFWQRRETESKNAVARMTELCSLSDDAVVACDAAYAAFDEALRGVDQRVRRHARAEPHVAIVTLLRRRMRA